MSGNYSIVLRYVFYVLLFEELLTLIKFLQCN